MLDSTCNTSADRPALTVIETDAQVLATQLTGNRIGFSVQVKQSAQIRLEVCDILGRALWAHDAFTNASHPYSVVWNAGKAASGMYFIKLLYPEGVATKRFTLTK